MAYQTHIPGLNATNNRIEGLMADFSGLKNLDKMVNGVIKRLELNDRVRQQVNMVRGGNMSRNEFDGWFSEVVRQELGKVLGIQRARAVQKARISTRHIRNSKTRDLLYLQYRLTKTQLSGERL
jgi:hypothetical protein